MTSNDANSTQTGMIEDDSTKAVIVGGLKTLAQLVPVVGGAVVQAYSEYDSYRQTKRVEDFFANLGEELRKLREAHEELARNVQKLPDAAELLERCVDAARRESSDSKRVVYSRMYCSFIASPTNTTEDERINLIQEIEQLTETDLEVLSTFARNRGVMRGDTITNTVGGDWSQVHNQADSEWLNKHGQTVHSIAKLVGRGLLAETEFNASFGYVGDPGSFANRFRKRAWTLTPIAHKLLQSISWGPSQ